LRWFLLSHCCPECRPSPTVVSLPFDRAISLLLFFSPRDSVVSSDFYL
jgi:hypothetical protein